MNVLYLFLPVYVSCQELLLKTKERAEITRGKYAPSEEQIHNVSVTPVHYVANLKNLQDKQSKNDSKDGGKKPIYEQLSHNSHETLIQSHSQADGKSPLKNIENTSNDKQIHNDSSVNSATPQLKSAQHLKALRNVIALQLLSYNGDPQSTTIPSTPQVGQIHTEKIPSSRKDDNMQKKLAVIAAARALMEILDA